MRLLAIRPLEAGAKLAKAIGDDGLSPAISLLADVDAAFEQKVFDVP